MKIILDTDPGVDDVLALLYALAHPDIEVVAIASVHGNVGSAQTTRNVVNLFRVIEADGSLPWMRNIAKGKVLLGVGADEPLDPAQAVDAAYFHGRDGLGGVTEKFPSLTAREDWQNHPLPAGLELSLLSSADLILDILKSEPADTVTIVAVGPLTNISLAISRDYETLSRAKEVVSMGGAFHVPGNVTPLAEFNYMADPEACAHVFAMTSPSPASTLPTEELRAAYQRSSTSTAHKPLALTVLPLDTTTGVLLHRDGWDAATSTALEAYKSGSNAGQGLLATWTTHFIDRTFETLRSLYTDASVEMAGLAMHDPACVWYCIAQVTSTAGWQRAEHVDVRIECHGRWTRGACVTDNRGRQRLAESAVIATDATKSPVAQDHDSWLHPHTGNRIAWVTHTPGSAAFVRDFAHTVFNVTIN
ncbi:hypothetical protein PYCC9005_002336 [Savitreella phatthalungensis]